MTMEIPSLGGANNPEDIKRLKQQRAENLRAIKEATETKRMARKGALEKIVEDVVEEDKKDDKKETFEDYTEK
jgi:hypothetical protein